MTIKRDGEVTDSGNAIVNLEPKEIDYKFNRIQMGKVHKT